ncbi:hypothetical protein GCM10010417_04150 [Streptomyces carpaticus]
MITFRDDFNSSLRTIDNGGGLVTHRGDCAALTGTVCPATPDTARRAVAAGAVRCRGCALRGGPPCRLGSAPAWTAQPVAGASGGA